MLFSCSWHHRLDIAGQHWYLVGTLLQAAVAQSAHVLVSRLVLGKKIDCEHIINKTKNMCLHFPFLFRTVSSHHHDIRDASELVELAVCRDRDGMEVGHRRQQSDPFYTRNYCRHLLLSERKRTGTIEREFATAHYNSILLLSLSSQYWAS